MLPGFSTSQKSQVTSSGVGAYLYFMPKLSFVPKFVNATFIVGYNKINVLHRFTGTLFSESEAEVFDSYRYEVKKIDYGFNLTILLARYFTLNLGPIIPKEFWGCPLGWIGKFHRMEPPILFRPHRRSRIYLGYIRLGPGGFLFLLLRVGRVDIHLGGLFGLIGNSAQGSDRIEDRSAKISLTYSFKSR